MAAESSYDEAAMIELHYDCLVPPRIAFGWGRRAEVGQWAKSLGSRAFILHGSRTLEQSGALDEIGAKLAAEGVEPVFVGGVRHEPVVSDVDRVVAQLRELGAGTGDGRTGARDLVIAVGGGSAIDLAKAACALAVDDQSPTVVDYLEGVGRGLTIDKPPLPQLAMPTTSGTGAEATKNAVISSYDPLFKKSLRSDLMVPRIVLADPELTVSVSPRTTAHTGMDAVTQLIESYVSGRARPIPQALCLQGLALAMGGDEPALVQAFRDGTNRPAREAMAHAALLSGIALANSGLGFAHGVAPALGVHCRVPHGLACAAMLAPSIRVNREVRRTEYARLAEAVYGRSFPSEDAAVDALLDRVDSVARELEIPTRLSELGVDRDRIPAIVASSRGNSMSANPREVTDEELTRILEDLS